MEVEPPPPKKFSPGSTSIALQVDGPSPREDDIFKEFKKDLMVDLGLVLKAPPLTSVATAGPGIF